MRKYLFIDLHMHSKYSNEPGCDASPKKLLDDSLTVAEKVRKSMISRVNQASKEELYTIIEDFVPYFIEDKAKQQLLKAKLLVAENKKEILIDCIKTKTQCTISITDHQSIMGSKVAMQIIKENPKKYETINFVSGIEVNAGLRCMGINKEGYSSFKKCHALAYNYDINDETFNAYNNLYNWTLKNPLIKKERNVNEFSYKMQEENIEIGKMILFAKKKVFDETGVKIPLKELGFLTKSKTCEEAQMDFIEYVSNTYNLKDIGKNVAINSCFRFDGFGNDKAISGSKWELDEYMEAIKNAGGQFSLAHPYSIGKKRTETEQKQLVKKFTKALAETTNDPAFYKINKIDNLDKQSFKENLKKINKTSNKNYSVKEVYNYFVDFGFGNDIEDFVERIIALRKGDNNFGFEIFNKINLDGAKSKILYDIANKYDLFLTGGSDHHGPHLHTHNRISCCFDNKFIYSDIDLFNESDKKLQKKINKVRSFADDNYLTQMEFIKFLQNPDAKYDKTNISFYNNTEGTMKFDSYLFDRHHTWIVENNSNPAGLRTNNSTEKITHIPRIDFRFSDNSVIDDVKIKDIVENKIEHNKEIIKEKNKPEQRRNTGNKKVAKNSKDEIENDISYADAEEILPYNDEVYFERLDNPLTNSFAKKYKGKSTSNNKQSKGNETKIDNEANSLNNVDENENCEQEELTM